MLGLDETSRLKRKARQLYLTMDRCRASADCGEALLREISPTYSESRAEFERVMGRLREIDPSAPVKAEGT